MTRNRNTHNITKLPLAQWEKSTSEWADAHGVAFRVSNGGHHWQFRYKQWAADWWPASQKLHIGPMVLEASTVDEVLQVLSKECPACGGVESPFDDDRDDDSNDVVTRLEMTERRLANVEEILRRLAKAVK